mmetsp:Transcript_4316/g.10415  ORF Transcript_4316/g.10415 Transcript_4316/m.10415 type:complete len:231 (+) Transcript_4316:170-862(+)
MHFHDVFLYFFTYLFESLQTNIKQNSGVSSRIFHNGIQGPLVQITHWFRFQVGELGIGQLGRDDDAPNPVLSHAHNARFQSGDRLAFSESHGERNRSKAVRVVVFRVVKDDTVEIQQAPAALYRHAAVGPDRLAPRPDRKVLDLDSVFQGNELGIVGSGQGRLRPDVFELGRLRPSGNGRKECSRGKPFQCGPTVARRGRLPGRHHRGDRAEHDCQQRQQEQDPSWHRWC